MSTLEEARQEVRTALAERKAAYLTIFASSAGRFVLDDLARFCRGRLTDTCWHNDPRVHAALEGRREVYNRIRAHMELPLDELVLAWAPEAAAVAPQGEDDDA